MAKKLMMWKTKGMNRDLSVSAFNPEFAFENINLRLSTNEGNTLMSWVNEKGTAQIRMYDGNSAEELGNEVSINGTVVGTAVLNHQLILFSTSSTADYIYKLKYLDEAKTCMQCRILYVGSLSLDTEHPLQTLVSYESESVQKVYWVDSKNQPRVINIAVNSVGKINTAFDFVRELQLNETVTVTKVLGATGEFAPGVIQYAFTYYDKYGQESNIFYTTPLYYISYADRGASPEDKVENAFRITVRNVDPNFDFLRIYSIQRTSINGTPICKRIQDIEISGLSNHTASYTDTGLSGESIDPTEILYKGGETISAGTLEQKDGTLFLGDIEIKRSSLVALKDTVKSIAIAQSSRTITMNLSSSAPYGYSNQLTAFRSTMGYSEPCGGFKYGDVYRLGVQFQHKSGKWSEPMWIKDETITNKPSAGSNFRQVTLPTLKGTIPASLYESLNELGYRKVRAVVVFPEMQDRNVICQGVEAPTVYTSNHRNVDQDLYAQSSWFFRFFRTGSFIDKSMRVAPISSGAIPYTKRNIEQNVPEPGAAYIPTDIRSVEIQGDYDAGNQFAVDESTCTFHSPEVEFNDQISVLDFTGVRYRKAGEVLCTNTMSDIDIQTSSPTVSNKGGGFVHKSFQTDSPLGIVAGLFYDDFLVDDCLGDDNHLGPYPKQRAACKWMVYPWQKTGSLNNDMIRPTDKGNATAVLKKKVISHLRYTTTDLNKNNSGNNSFSTDPQLFNSDECQILKMDNKIYQGNIDTMLMPDHSDGVYFCFDGYVSDDMHLWKWWQMLDKNTEFTSTKWFKTFSRNEDQQDQNGIRCYNTNDKAWYWCSGVGDDSGDDIGDEFVDLVIKKQGVRMKYKSTPHILTKHSTITPSENSLNIIEIVRASVTNRFGGTSNDALKENTWVPCGTPVRMNGQTDFYYEYGDTYFQRYDCLKTYPFTREDENQIVEIGSFMLESHVNIDGRYDRNRGQQSNINMSPQNFNLMNPVYSQIDNFFNYKIMDDDAYKLNSYPNQITWSKTKNSGADIDLWTNITMASILELDGDKGKVNKLVRFNDQLLCFQDSGISQILYNENTQISTAEGVPIEIANSGKVQGKRYLSNTVGCSNKWSIVQTPVGIYFMDSNDKSIYLFNGQLQNISQQGMNAWSKKYIPSQEKKWTPLGYEAFAGFYDKMNQDVLFINSETALAWSEKLSVFTSFYDYGKAPFFCNLDDTGIWVASDSKLWKHQAGDYCKFFGTYKPYSMTLVGNPDPQMDKIFTNLEFRANVDDDGIEVNSDNIDTFDESFDYTFHPGDAPFSVFRFYLPFDSLEVWNEYQHGIATLSQKNGRGPLQHSLSDGTAHLDRKFRMWRCDIPRNNYPLPTSEAETAREKQLGISRKIRKPQDRMRNPWLYLKLAKEANSSDKRMEIHDIVMTYFN